MVDSFTNAELDELKADVKKVNDFVDEAKDRFKMIDNRFDQMESRLQTLIQSVSDFNRRAENMNIGFKETLALEIPAVNLLGRSMEQHQRTSDFSSFDQIKTTGYVINDFSRLDRIEEMIKCMGLINEPPSSHSHSFKVHTPPTMQNSFSQPDNKFPQEQSDVIDELIIKDSSPSTTDVPILDAIDDPKRDNPKIAVETDLKGDDYVFAPNKESDDGIGTECYDSTPILALMVVKVVPHGNLIMSKSTLHCAQTLWPLELSMGEPPPTLFISSSTFHHFTSVADSNFVFDPGVEFCWPYCHNPHYSPISPVVFDNVLLVLLAQYIENEILRLFSNQGTILHFIEMPILCLIKIQSDENKTTYVLHQYYLGTRVDEHDNIIVVTQVVRWAIDTMLILHVTHDIAQGPQNYAHMSEVCHGNDLDVLGNTGTGFLFHFQKLAAIVPTLHLIFHKFNAVSEKIWCCAQAHTTDLGRVLRFIIGHRDFHDFIGLLQGISISIWRDWCLSFVQAFFANLIDATYTDLVPLISSKIWVFNPSTHASGLQLFLHFEFIVHIYRSVAFCYNEDLVSRDSEVDILFHSSSVVFNTFGLHAILKKWLGCIGNQELKFPLEGTIELLHFLLPYSMLYSFCRTLASEALFIWLGQHEYHSWTWWVCGMEGILPQISASEGVNAVVEQLQFFSAVGSLFGQRHNSHSYTTIWDPPKRVLQWITIQQGYFGHSNAISNGFQICSRFSRIETFPMLFRSLVIPINALHTFFMSQRFESINAFPWKFILDMQAHFFDLEDKVNFQGEGNVTDGLNKNMDWVHKVVTGGPYDRISGLQTIGLTWNDLLGYIDGGSECGGY